MQDSMDTMGRTALYEKIVGAGEDAPEPGEARNGLIHIASLTLSKVADGLIDPKLILSWLLSALGAPGAAIGALVPVREAGALLPQLALARWVEASPVRRYFWVAGSAVQGIAALGIALAALTLEGAAAGVAIVGCLAVLSLARAASSTSYKDVLARTVSKRRRGAVTGLAASAAAIAAFGAGLVMATGVFPVAVTPLALLVAGAGGAFLTAALLFSRLDETAEAPQDIDASGLERLVAPLFEDRQLALFVVTRALLAGTALAPPFIVMLSSATAESALDQLGPLVMASTAASFASGYLWGRLSDRSSRQTLMASGALAAVVFAVIGALGLGGGGLGGAMGAALAIFAAQIAYEGVRAGRKLHLTDMAEDDLRARYTALSNTLIGLALLAGGLFGLAADTFGPEVVLITFALLSAGGAALASRLEEVQTEG